MKPMYTVGASAVGGREGRVFSESPKFEHALSMPKELGGAGGEGTNPEQLFAAGYSACFESALLLVARRQKIDLREPTITARVSLGRTEAGLFQLAVQLTGKLPGLAPEQARALMEAAHQVCPYSNATRNNIEVTLAVE